jgi:hypothetical protein
MLSERKFGWPEWDQVIPLNFLSGCFAISSRYPEEGSRDRSGVNLFSYHGKLSLRYLNVSLDGQNGTRLFH